MKIQTREFKLVSPAIDNTFSRSRDPEPRATLMLTDSRGVDWIVLVKGQEVLEKALLLAVGDVVELRGKFRENEVITNMGRSQRRSGEAMSIKRIKGFTNLKKSTPKMGSQHRKSGSTRNFMPRIPKRQQGWMVA